MSLNAIQGLMGAGKSYIAVNDLLPQFLRETRRPIYTNLPCDGLELDSLLLSISTSPVRQQEMRDRIHFLPRKVGTREKCVDYTDDEGVVHPGEVHDRLAEFWFFTRANAIIILDELADIYGSDDYAKRKDESPTLKSYMLHHRHYKDDLYFFCQDRKDIDCKIREKLQYVWTVRNSLYENVFKWWGLRGLKWPVQFFIVKVYLGPRVLKMDSMRTDACEPERSYRVWPKKSGFRNYRSFSASSKLAGKALPSAEDVSSDCDPSVWNRMRNWSRQWAMLATMGSALAAAIYFGTTSLWAMTSISSADIERQMFAKKGTNENRAALVSGSEKTGAKRAGVLADNVPQHEAATNSLPKAGASVEAGHAKDSGGIVEGERVRLVTPDRFITTKGKVYEIGSMVGGKRIARFIVHGVEFEGGGSARYDDVIRAEARGGQADVLLQRGRGDGGASGGGNQ